ncbi:Na(+) H(+) antiporter subunit B [Olavius algarvensis Delta 1 endosymbiont]|nr:Na(+) H(+) antiporter subunit B [Olavius algarvensis Delta 1 endosymbiont]
MKAIGLILVAVMGGLLIYCSLEFPLWGDPHSPASTHVSPYYIENTIKDTSVPNIVTAVLADYRSYDTMFETIVIFTAGIACIFLLRTFKTVEPDIRLYRHIPTGMTLRIEKGGKFPADSSDFERLDTVWIPHALIVRTTCRLVIPFIQIFALYVIAHGHYSPGGGFQGGVIMGASMVLLAIAFDLRSAIRRLGERMAMFLCVLGVIIYAGTGTLCMLFDKNYLDYSALALFGLDPVSVRSHGILVVEIGVGIVVMAVMIILYYSLASSGKLDEGL